MGRSEGRAALWRERPRARTQAPRAPAGLGAWEGPPSRARPRRSFSTWFVARATQRSGQLAQAARLRASRGPALAACRSGSESCGHGQLPCGLRLLGVRRVCSVDFHEMVPGRAARPWAWAQASLSAVRREGACRPAGQESARHLAGRASGSGGVVRVWAPVLSPRSRARRVRLVRRSGRGVAVFGRPRRRPARQGQHREPPAGPPPQAQPPSHGVAPRAE